MICDDDEGISDMLEIILEEAGFSTFTEQNSLNIFDSIAIYKPDVLLLDLWMPVLSGDQVLLRLRKDDKTQALPVIVISASPDGRSVALNAGASRFLAKPFDLDHLIELIDLLALTK